MSKMEDGIHYLTNGVFLKFQDQFFHHLWSTIDSAKTNIWILTYTFDNSFTGQLTMNKLIEAQQRGVQVTLLVDDLNQSIDSHQKKQLIRSGGVFQSLNPCFKIWNLFNRDILHRHHEKIIVIDDTSIIGSSNITDEYSSTKFGQNQFLDINQINRNMFTNQSREYFKSIASYYNINLHPTVNNENIVNHYNNLYPEQIKDNYRLISSNYYNENNRQIQDIVIDMIEKATKNIVIVQPYYYPIKKIEKALASALDRGVKIELITSSKRDQPCYRQLSNIYMTEKLRAKGLELYELHSKLLHMKMYIVDDSVYTLGSFNNDRISWRINNELNVLIKDFSQAAELKKVVDNLKQQCIIAEENFRTVGIFRKSKIKYWEFILRCGDWLGYKSWFKRMNKFAQTFQTYNNNKFFIGWDGHFDII